MLVTKSEEISAWLPTSVHEAAEDFLMLTDDTEETYLVPVLGRSLYEKTVDAYRSLVEEHGSVLPSVIPDEDLTPEIRLIRLCQMSVVYFTLANSTGLLSLSLNDGGGFNRVETEGYGAADDKSLDRFERDAWFKARRGIDRILVFLEEDARSESPAFAELWRESAYFYRQGDLLFTTAVEFDRFLSIGGSREKFISLLPDIRYCQSSYIVPEIGEGLTEAFVGAATGSVKIPEGQEAVWRRATDFLKMSLALWVESRKPEKQRRYSENEASLSLVRAKEYISAHQESFGEYIKGSPLYRTPPAYSPECGKAESFDNRDNGNAIYVFGHGINRH